MGIKVNIIETTAISWYDKVEICENKAFEINIMPIIWTTTYIFEVVLIFGLYLVLRLTGLLGYSLATSSGLQ